jgi:hypothetical protein
VTISPVVPDSASEFTLDSSSPQLIKIVLITLIEYPYPLNNSLVFHATNFVFRLYTPATSKK